MSSDVQGGASAPPAASDERGTVIEVFNAPWTWCAVVEYDTDDE